MPELPEVETVRVGLNELIVGKKVSGFELLNAKTLRSPLGDAQSFLIGSTVSGLRRRGKLLIIDFDSKYSALIHLRMTGQLVYVQEAVNSSVDQALSAESTSPSFNSESTSQQASPSLRFGAGHPNDSLIGRLPDNSTRAWFEFSDDSRLYFNDQRKFGYIILTPTDLVEQDSFVAKLGPEPLEDSFTKNVFNDRLQAKKNSKIKTVLLDQTVLAGIGNIYADEALHAAKIHPEEIVKDISEDKIDNLYAELKSVLKKSIQLGGSSDKNYVDASGKKGSYLKFAKVFRRENQPCESCGNNITKTRVAGRGTHICENCQPLKSTPVQKQKGSRKWAKKTYIW